MTCLGNSLFPVSNSKCFVILLELLQKLPQPHLSFKDLELASHPLQRHDTNASQNMLFDRIKSIGNDKETHSSSGGATRREDVPAAASSGPTGIDRIQEIGKYALDANTNNNLEGLRAQILGKVKL